MSIYMMIATSALFLGAPAPECDSRDEWTLVVHGGAGAWEHTEEIKKRMSSILRGVLEQGGRMLSEGQSALDVTEAVIIQLEDAPEFNAGRGGVPNREGYVELDAAIMRGVDRAAGAVAGLRTIKNPIRLARMVMEDSPHVMFVGRGAEAFALKAGLEQVEPNYFLVKTKSEAAKAKQSKAGTVGAVVADRCGQIVAGTSTGGYRAKIPGRVGDVPVIGAGTFADQSTAAISATGWGEWFIRYNAAYDVSALIAYKKLSLSDALKEVLGKIKAPAGATGGLIAVTADGEWASHHSSPGMLRGVISHRNPQPRVGIYDKIK